MHFQDLRMKVAGSTAVVLSPWLWTLKTSSDRSWILPSRASGGSLGAHASKLNSSLPERTYLFLGRINETATSTMPCHHHAVTPSRCYPITDHPNSLLQFNQCRILTGPNDTSTIGLPSHSRERSLQSPRACVSSKFECTSAGALGPHRMKGVVIEESVVSLVRAG